MRRLWDWLTGRDVLKAEVERLRKASIEWDRRLLVANDLAVKYRGQAGEANDLLAKAEWRHIQDQAQVTEAHQKIFQAVGALTGGIEILQQTWLQEAPDVRDPLRKRVNELGNLKNAILTQFGRHPNQRAKTAKELGFSGSLHQALPAPEGD